MILWGAGRVGRVAVGVCVVGVLFVAQIGFSGFGGAGELGADRGDLGAAVSYFIVFPLTIRFLGTYTVSELVPNQISLQSYMSTLYILVFSMGLMFEMPVLAYFLSRMGIVTREGLKKFRNYAVVGVLVISAFITPTTDPFTMLVVAFPLYVLYEVSILVCRKETPEKDDEEETES